MNESYKGEYTMKNSKYQRITITLTPSQLDFLSNLMEAEGYETMSRTVRVLVQKYEKEIRQTKDS